MLIGLIVNLAISIIVAAMLGEKRKIGMFLSFVFCATLSVPIGVIITLLSPLKTSNKPVQPKVVAGTIIGSIGGLGLLGFIYRLITNGLHPTPNYSVLVVGGGILILGIYLAFPDFFKAERK